MLHGLEDVACDIDTSCGDGEGLFSVPGLPWTKTYLYSTKNPSRGQIDVGTRDGWGVDLTDHVLKRRCCLAAIQGNGKQRRVVELLGASYLMQWMRAVSAVNNYYDVLLIDASCES